MNTLSVSALNEQIKGVLESTFCRVLVEGELSRITFHNSGHIYFTLKDRSSTLKAVMFRGNASKLKFRLEEGMKVVIDGAITLYKPRGEYQINCFSIQPSGQGALALAYEQLKEKLSTKGYFATERKKTLPSLPSKIALVTSATGAALQDMLRVANNRYRNVEIDIYDVLVQGESAASGIVNAIELADKKEYDILIVGRGGGSIEDLWAFNEEVVADAIFNASTPVISAVGHEIDWVISDFVADVRAATPSNAMEICLPDTNELFQYLDGLSNQYERLISQKILEKEKDVKHLLHMFSQHSLEKRFEQKKVQLKQLQEQFDQRMSFKLEVLAREKVALQSQLPSAVDSIIRNKKAHVENLQRMLESNNPALKSKRGFAQISKDKKVIDISELKIDESFDVQSDKVYINAKVLSKEIRE